MALCRAFSSMLGEFLQYFLPYEAFGETRFIFKWQALTFKEIYNKIRKVVPNETVTFENLTLNQALICELICSALCHQINWEFLRNVIWHKSLNNPNWLTAEYLSTIDINETYKILRDYSKPDRLHIYDRTRILNDIGNTYVNLPNGINSVFFDSYGLPNKFETIYYFLNQTRTFSNDPMKKKLYLLISKISNYSDFHFLGDKCKPTIDYHIIRSFIRRGFIFPKNKLSMMYIHSNSIKKESTVAAVRKHCSNMVYQICAVSQLNINEINLIEWWIGRSVCKEHSPDCLLLNNDSKWLKPLFNKCPFYDYCEYISDSKSSFDDVDIKYLGTSY